MPFQSPWDQPCVTGEAPATCRQSAAHLHQTTALGRFLRACGHPSWRRRYSATRIAPSISSTAKYNPTAPRTLAYSVIGAPLVSVLRVVSGFTDRAPRAAKRSNDDPDPLRVHRGGLPGCALAESRKVLYASEAHARRLSRTRVGVELSSASTPMADIVVAREHYSGNFKREIQYTI
jgi:hypothetical protein